MAREAGELTDDQRAAQDALADEQQAAQDALADEQVAAQDDLDIDLSKYTGRRLPTGPDYIPAIAAAVIVVTLVLLGALMWRYWGRPPTVPDVEMMTSAEARSAIEAAGFTFGEETVSPESDVAPGLVVDQSPEAEAKAEPGTAVDITVSAEPTD